MSMTFITQSKKWSSTPLSHQSVYQFYQRHIDKPHGDLR